MAWTITRTRVVFGNRRGVQLKISADSATMNVDTGLKTVKDFTWSFGSYTTNANGPKLVPNSGTAGTALAGYLGCSGFTAGDEFYVTVFG